MSGRVFHLIHYVEADYLRWCRDHPVGGDEHYTSRMPLNRLGPEGDWGEQLRVSPTLQQDPRRAVTCRACAEPILRDDEALTIVFTPTRDDGTAGSPRVAWIHRHACLPEHTYHGEAAWSRTPA